MTRDRTRSSCPHHAEGLILLTGCSRGRVPILVANGEQREAKTELRKYLQWFGPENVFAELQRNLVYGDTPRNRRLHLLARRSWASESWPPTTSTTTSRSATGSRTRWWPSATTRAWRRPTASGVPNTNFYLKSPAQMAALFDEVPDAISNSVHIAERCAFNLKEDLGYRFPDYPVPDGHTPQTYLEKLCHEAAVRRYGSITPRVPGAPGRRVPPGPQARPSRLLPDLPRDNPDGPRRDDRAGPSATARYPWRRGTRAGEGAPRWRC